MQPFVAKDPTAFCDNLSPGTMWSRGRIAHLSSSSLFSSSMKAATRGLMEPK